MPIGVRSDKKDANTREFTSAILNVSLNKFYFFVLESEAELPTGSPWGNVVVGEGELSSFGHQSLQRLLRCQRQGKLVRSSETKLILMKCLKKECYLNPSNLLHLSQGWSECFRCLQKYRFESNRISFANRSTFS